MNDQPKPSLPGGLGGPGGNRRRAVAVTGDSLVNSAPLFEGQALPLLVTPAVPGVDLSAWAASHRPWIEEKLQEHGGLLFRGFGVAEPAAFERFIEAASGEALEYRERSSPRSSVAGNIYTSTDYPADQWIFLHNENSYQAAWPLKIFFCCHTASPTGGETPIADCRKVLAAIDPEVRERFAEKSWRYVRNFGDGFGLAWQTVFQTEDRAKVEEHCAKSGIQAEWKEGNRLRTVAVRPALAKHPKTGETLWFNHATFFHISTLDEAIQEALLEEFDETDLPANSYYGDGASIEPEVAESLREAYRQATVSFPWQKGDVLMLDNMLVAHGRAPYTGDRKILVGMAEAIQRGQAS